MAIFNKGDQPTTQSSETSIVASGAKIEGTVTIESKLHIDGEINGQIFSNNVVTIGKTGRFKGDMRAYKLIVSGHFEGTVDSDTVEILENGTIIGKVLSRDFMIESKAHFEGESKIKRDSGNDLITIEPEKISHDED